MQFTRRTFVALAAGAAAEAQKISPRQDTFALMKKVNAWQVANPVMKPDDRNWERGTWYTGVMAAWRATNDQSYYQQALDWGRKHNWQVGTERMNGANRLFCVQTWLELYFKEKDKAMVQPVVEWLATDAPNSPGGAKRWYVDPPMRAYVDSLYGASALAMLSKATGNTKYLEIMHAFFEDVTGELFDRQDGLYYRDNRFIGQKAPNGRKIFWSRGNGWAFAGIPRLLDYLPKDDPKRGQYLDVFRQMATALAKRQPEDGLWRPNLDDPERFPLRRPAGRDSSVSGWHGGSIGKCWTGRNICRWYGRLGRGSAGACRRRAKCCGANKWTGNPTR